MATKVKLTKYFPQQIINTTKILRYMCSKYEPVNLAVMSIRSFFKARDGVPDPKGSLSTSLPSCVITLTNKEVISSTSKMGGGKKRGLYRR